MMTNKTQNLFLKFANGLNEFIIFIGFVTVFTILVFLLYSNDIINNINSITGLPSLKVRFYLISALFLFFYFLLLYGGSAIIMELFLKLIKIKYFNRPIYKQIMLFFLLITIVYILFNLIFPVLIDEFDNILKQFDTKFTLVLNPIRKILTGFSIYILMVFMALSNYYPYEYYIKAIKKVSEASPDETNSEIKKP